MYITCVNCSGTGKVRRYLMNRQCDTCNGRGRLYRADPEPYTPQFQSDNAAPFMSHSTFFNDIPNEPQHFTPAGGESGGGAASGSWDTPSSTPAESYDSGGSSYDSGSSDSSGSSGSND